MTLRPANRSSLIRSKTLSRLLLLSIAATGLVVACSDGGTTGDRPAGGAGSAGIGTAGGGTGNLTAGSSTGGSGVLPTAGMSGTGVAQAGNAGAGGSAGTAGGNAGAAGTAGAGGAAGTAGSGGTAGTGGTTPVCTVPVTGGEDFAALLVGPTTVEGEDSTLGGAAVVASDGSGWLGTGFADMKGAEGSMTWLVDVPVAGDYTVTWTYTQNDARDMRLAVNCAVVTESLAFTNTASWNTGWVLGGAQLVTLKKGTNQIVLETNGGSGPNFDSMTITPPVCELSAGTSSSCQAEVALMSGNAALRSQGSGWTGPGFADMLGAEGAVNWVLDAPDAGSYTLTFVYTQNDARDMTLTVNGAVAAASLAFNNTGSWNTAWASDISYDVQLNAGLNSVQLATNGASGPNFDRLEVLSPGAGGAGAGGAGSAGAGGAP